MHRRVDRIDDTNNRIDDTNTQIRNLNITSEMHQGFEQVNRKLAENRERMAA